MHEETDNRVLSEWNKQITYEHDPLEIVLFGSMAKGTPDESSDLDILVYTKKEFELIKKQNSTFFNEVSETGKIVYEKVSILKPDIHQTLD